MKKRKKSVDFSLGKKEKVKVNPKAAGRRIINTALIVFAAVVLGYGLITFCVQTVYMTGSSMESVISDGDELILNKMAYKASKIRRYDIVAIKKIGSDDYYDIKRVIGLPGDSISVVAGRLVINGKHTNDDLPFSYINTPGVLDETIKLGDEEYFVIGDNTSNSEDSRYINYGNVQKSEIKGKITYRISPKEKRGKID
ncbi:MAG: signal peptidase I [Eubacterium sp.]|nr:signal peptidase I [Eubacterium sp.]